MKKNRIFSSLTLLCTLIFSPPSEIKAQSGNVKLGTNAGLNNTTGNYNTLIGEGAGRVQQTVNGSTFVGYLAGENNTGGGNIFVGGYVGRGNTSGYYNSFIGWSAGYGNTTGYFNTYYGTSAGYSITAGNNNTFIGGNTGRNTGLSPTPTINNNCTFLGYDATGSAENLTNSTAIGFGAKVSSSNALILGNSSVNVGIGVSAPSAKLEISTGVNGSSGLKFSNLTNSSNTVTNNGKVLSVDANGNVILTTSLSSSWDNATIGTNNIINTNTGGVIVGTGITSLPSGYKLYVSDGILAEKVTIAPKNTFAWADFVFDTNYKLRPLSELESYIQQNKHLPEIPSTSEVQEKGLNLLENHAKLLQKIEELTLYVIDQNKKIKLLEKKLHRIKRD